MADVRRTYQKLCDERECTVALGSCFGAYGYGHTGMDRIIPFGIAQKYPPRWGLVTLVGHSPMGNTVLVVEFNGAFGALAGRALGALLDHSFGERS